MSILITGDCHGDFFKFSSDNFPRGKKLTKDDYVIILGDAGFIWNKEASKDENYWLDWLDAKPWTTLFIDGNHENFDRLNNCKEYPIERWCGGLVQKIRPSVIRLRRGEVFNIDGCRILAMGGAASHDIDHGIIDPADYETREDMNKACRELEKKHGGWQFAMYRIKGESWWAQEVPDAADRENCLYNLKLCGNEVDYVISHEAPSSVVALASGGYFKPDEYSHWLEDNIRCKVNYKRWLFGHYHLDHAITDKEICYYRNFNQIW